MVTYTIWLSSPAGTRLALVDGWLQLDYTRAVNAIGTLKLVLPGSYPAELLQRDYRLEVWRQVDGGPAYLDTDTSWFIRRAVTRIAKRVRTVEVTAYSAAHLLKRRLVAYNSGTSQAEKTAAADNIMKAIVRENLGSLASDSARSLAGWLAVEADTGLGPSITKAMARRPVLAVLQEIAQASAIAGTPVYFDITGSETLTFCTFAGQRGLDQTSPAGMNPIILSPELGNIDDIEYSDDSSDEITFVYAGGQGEGANRLTATASDTTRMNASPFNRIEQLLDARNATTSAQLGSEAQAALRQGRPRVTLAGTIIQTPASIYGRHWSWGSKLTAQVEGASFNCRVDTVAISVKAQGAEQVKAQLRSDT